jgi:hypothetical protein
VVVAKGLALEMVRVRVRVLAQVLVAEVAEIVKRRWGSWLRVRPTI